MKYFNLLVLLAVSMSSFLIISTGSVMLANDGTFPSFCNLSCAKLTCEQAYQCGYHPVRDRDQDGRACERECW